ncbi:MAG: hypothetical protein B6U94_01595 [Thermofilum sp. ex4484_79]|nr:MAG: hypothetical protein B6U94_01595 [Thermofilum sp. ex4484_79]
MSSHIAIDLGAESGRISIVKFEDEKITFSEVYRFPTSGTLVPIDDREILTWNILRFWEEIIKGLRMLKSREVSSIGVDTWGVDFALLDRIGELVSYPYHYRDRRTENVMNMVMEKLGKEFIYKNTGIQFMPINTLYQLYSMVLSKSPLLDIAKTFLMIPDLINYWFTGRKYCEFTDATTTQFYNPNKENWSYEILEPLEIPTEIFPEIISPGTILGTIREEVKRHIGYETEVIATTSHDTASAVVAVPATEENFAYISSGTWSLVGIEVDHPIINEKSLMYNFTNEGGYGRTFRFLKNVSGLWLIQELRREWYINGRNIDYSEIVKIAANEKGFRYFIDPDYEEFIFPSHKPMSLRISEYCRNTNQQTPSNYGEIARTIFESLAFKYRWVIEKIEEIYGKTIKVIHIVGGGSKNYLLNQITADITRKKVVAGPSEATTIGNAVVQMIAQGEIRDIKKARRTIRESFDLKVYTPKMDESIVEEAYNKWKLVVFRDS